MPMSANVQTSFSCRTSAPAADETRLLRDEPVIGGDEERGPGYVREERDEERREDPPAHLELLHSIREEDSEHDERRPEDRRDPGAQARQVPRAAERLRRAPVLEDHGGDPEPERSEHGPRAGHGQENAGDG